MEFRLSPNGEQVAASLVNPKTGTLCISIDEIGTGKTSVRDGNQLPTIRKNSGSLLMESKFVFRGS
jgi:hypothetical protein